MRLDAVGESPLERLIARTNVPPWPHGGYALMPLSRKWLRRESPHCLADKLLLQFAEWDWMERSDDYVRTGRPLTWTPEEMASWQRDAGMRPRRPLRFRTVPGAGAQIAEKPS